MCGIKCIVFAVLLFGITDAQRTYLQPENKTKVPETSVCYQGTNQDYTDEHCLNSQDMCLTSVNIRGGEMRVTKSCTETEECLVLQRSGENLCTGFDPTNTQESTCHICCVGDRCNFFDTAAELEEAYGVISRIKISP